MKRCKKCLCELNGRVCPRCGYVEPKKINFKHVAVYFAAIFAFGAIMFLVKSFLY